MLVANNVDVENFCKQNKLKFNKPIKLFNISRINAQSKDKNNLIVHVEGTSDFMKQKNSNIDEVICKILYEKEKQVYFDLNELLNSKQKHLLIARIKQNIRLLKKYKVKYDFVFICDSVDDIISDVDIVSLLKILE